jgi:hypothetical protein
MDGRQSMGVGADDRFAAILAVMRQTGWNCRLLLDSPGSAP